MYKFLSVLPEVIIVIAGDGGGPGGSGPLDLGSGVLAQTAVTFISPNNTRVLAHQGSRVHLPCRIEKPPNSAMVSTSMSYFDCDILMTVTFL